MIEGLLDRPGRFAQVLEADHASASLEGMGGAADGREGLDIVGVAFEYGVLLPHGRQDFLGFFQEDFEQFRVDLLVAGLGELERRRRWGRRFGSHGTQICGNWIESSGFQGGKGRLGGFAQFVIGDEVGILLDGLQILLEFVTQLGVGRLLAQSVHQRLGFLALLLQLLFDGGGGQGGFFLVLRFRLGLRFAEELADELPVIGSTVLQRIDEEAQHRQIAGDRFEFVLVGAVVGLGKPLDLGAAAREGFQGAVMAEDGQGAIDLVEGVV